MSQLTLLKGKVNSLRGIVDSFRADYDTIEAFSPHSNWLQCSKKNQHFGLLTIKVHSLGSVLTKNVSFGVWAVDLYVPDLSMH